MQWRVFLRSLRMSVIVYDEFCSRLQLALCNDRGVFGVADDRDCVPAYTTTDEECEYDPTVASSFEEPFLLMTTSPRDAIPPWKSKEKLRLMTGDWSEIKSMEWLRAYRAPAHALPTDHVYSVCKVIFGSVDGATVRVCGEQPHVYRGRRDAMQRAAWETLLCMQRIIRPGYQGTTYSSGASPTSWTHCKTSLDVVRHIIDTTCNDRHVSARMPLSDLTDAEVQTIYSYLVSVLWTTGSGIFDLRIAEFQRAQRVQNWKWMPVGTPIFVVICKNIL